ncbi:MAG TPA: hypothetical protein VKZ49_16990 [Polyangiaceae bacterium]|nr:hypothetical protein [Polyangiaceae bacterium]
MNYGGWALWGFIGTIVLTTVMVGSQRLSMTRINIPYMLGTMVTPNRDRAKIIGIALHLINGWLLSAIYVAAFHALGRATVWLGALMGLVHALFVLVVALPALPGLHPRMASDTRGPEVVEQLEPPGFMALHYGFQTPISVLVAHLVFGAVLGAFYRW